MDQTFRDKQIAVVTGASAGVGRAVAMRFANSGYRVALISRDRDRLESTRRDIEAAGGEALVFPADVSNEAALFEASDGIVRHWGRIDCWVNNAMATIFAPAHEVAPDEFKRVMEVTFLGQVYGTLAALRHMTPRNYGTIVQVGSALSYRSIPLQAPYCAAKFAVRGFTDSLRSALIHDGSRVRLTMVQLPAVNTPQFDWARSRMPRRLQPVPPIYQPEAIAGEILKAARCAPRELWIGWPTIRAILGNMLAPRLLDRLAAQQAWEGQMTSEPAASNHDGNLFNAPPGDPGAHGRFNSRSRRTVLSASDTVVRCLAATIGVTAALFASTIITECLHHLADSPRGLRK